MKIRRTKIVTTIGPATFGATMLERLIRAGANVIRLNFSHGTFQDHAKSIEVIRKVSKKLQTEAAILVDLPGPKLRTGTLKGGKPIRLLDGGKTKLTTRPVEGTVDAVPVTFQSLPRLLKKNDRLLLADGLIELKVTRTSKQDIYCRIVNGGILGRA